MYSAGEITALLKEFCGGRKQAADELMPLVYQELKRLARLHMGGEKGAHTLQPTALVHEVYLRLIDQSQADWRSRSHFFGVAARCMRHILVDHARAKKALKRGGPEQQMLSIQEVLIHPADEARGVLAIDEALDRLEEVDPRQCRIVELRFFVGLSIDEVAEVLQTSPRTVKREWTMAKAWLYGELCR
jgi:RNA polymerase sigma factor (TIGR02999 family)